jgi:hypothetical protein
MNMETPGPDPNDPGPPVTCKSPPYMKNRFEILAFLDYYRKLNGFAKAPETIPPSPISRDW